MRANSPYDPPKSSLLDGSPGETCQRGRYVIHRPESEWPSRCFKCNKVTSSYKRLTLTYVNPWIYLSLLVTFLLTILLALLFRKRFTENLPLCEDHIKRRTFFLILQWCLLITFVGAMLFGAFSESDSLLVLSVIVFLALVISALFGRVAFAARFKDGNLWITGAGKKFRESLPEYSNL